MDRRKFIKTTALSSAALATAGVIPAEAKSKPKEVKTPLPVRGYVQEPAKRIPVVDRADVIVAGGGPAGFAAAVCAAREGADVILLEREYFLGGLFLGCGVTPIINMYQGKGDEKQQVVFGVADELCRRLEPFGMVSLGAGSPRVDPEAAKYMMEEMSCGAGVRILYGVRASEVVMSGDRIDSVIIESKSGRVAINTGFVIDCTGDGDILSWAGEDYSVYKDDIGAMWRIGNAENCTKGAHTCVKGVRGRHSTGEKDQDGLDMYNLTRVQLGLRKMMWEEAQELRKQEGCGDLFLLDSPTVVGVRVTRVLDSVSNVSYDNAAAGKSYDDVIGITGGRKIKNSAPGTKKKDRMMWQVPYSAITPKRVSNLLVAGRCFGFERRLTYDAREIGTCFVTGQAAGTAAALAVASRVANREINIPELQKRLRAQNVKLDW